MSERRQTLPSGCRSANSSGTRIALLFSLLAVTLTAFAGERQGAYIAEVEDEDGDLVIVMETDWISMRLMPQIGATVIRFCYRPTQNETCEIMQPKNLRGGGGLLQDNVWEQDWRFQELRGKWYDYKITKRGPEEVQIAFQTQLIGWLQFAGSGLKSKLLENLIIRRTVTLRQGTPYFLFDVEFLNPDQWAKLPLYWCHNRALIDVTSHDHYIRPTDLGLSTIPLGGGMFVYNFNHGWSANMSARRREGLVYLMDYDYVNFLYNCTPMFTTEWVYDNLLVFRDRPVKTRIYVLPTMGLEQVDHANEYFILQLEPVRDRGLLRLEYKLTASYQKARKVTLLPKLEYDLLANTPQRAALESLEFAELSIEPTSEEATFEGESSDPVKITTTAFIDLADGTQVKRSFEHFHVGDYTMGKNVRKDGKTPVARLKRRPQDPYVPTPSPDLEINRKDFKVYALLGNMSRVLGVEDALRSIPDMQLTVGYHPGFLIGRTGLTDFPYDYERLFEFRAVVVNNSVLDTARHVGLCILENYLKRGGGLLYGGGDNVFGFTRYNDRHPVHDFLPIARGSRIIKQTVRVSAPARGHPVFTGIDLSDLPYVYYVQKVKLKESLPTEPKVLLRVGEDPLIIEYCPIKGQRTIVLLALPFGDPEENPGKTQLFQWPEWQKLYANLVRYVGQDL